MPVPEPTGQQPGNSPAAPAAPAAGLTPEQLNQALANHAAGVNKSVEDWSKQIAAELRAQRQPTQPRQPAAPARTTDPAAELISALAAGDLSPIETRQAEAAKKAVEEAMKPLLPWIQSQVRDSGGAHETAFRTVVDGKYGAGAYDTVIKPKVDAGFGDNHTARSSRETFDNVVKWAIGETVDDLLKHKAAADTVAKAAQEEADKKMQARQPFLLGNGITLPDGEQLSAEDATDAARIEAATGETVDRGKASKLIQLMHQRGEKGVSRKDFKRTFAQAS